jgi:hypothetical protein
MSAVYHDLSALAAAAAACDCSAHIHNDEEGNTVYSIGNSNIGAATFSTYELALHWAKNRAAGDDAEMAGGNIANALLNDLLTAEQYACIMQALARLEQENAQLKQLMLDAIADVSDLQARIEAVNMRFDD